MNKTEVTKKKMSGTFAEPQHGGKVSEFSGTISIGHRTDMIIGEIVDAYGIATIMGNMDEELMMFAKRYNNRRDVIVYALKKQPDAVWIGKWAYALILGQASWLADNEISSWPNARMAALQIADAPESKFGLYGGVATCSVQ